MLRTRWYKVFADLWGNRGRTLVVALAIAVGVYSVGVIINTQELLVREHGRDQQEALIATAVLTTTPFDETLAERMTEIPGVLAAEGRFVLDAYAYDGAGERRDLRITAVPDFEDMTVDSLTPLAGEWPPLTNEIIVERLVPAFLAVEIGQELVVEMEDGTHKRLTISGSAHDAQQFSPQVTDTGTGYVTPDTMRRLGFGDQFTELRLRLDPALESDADMRAVLDQVEDQIERSGRPVLASTFIGEGPAAPIIDTVIFILSSFGLIILLLSGFLVVNAITALIMQQVQQIGVMKLIGASRLQIMGMYFLTVLVYGLIAVAIGIPTSIFTAQVLMAQIVEPLLNVSSESLAIPTWLIAAQVGMGLALPLLAGLLPVLKGTRITTQKALQDTGMGASVEKDVLTERILAQVQKIRPLQRQYLLSIRNTLRHKGRLAQTLLVLIIGTALFISVLSVNRSVNATLDTFLRHHQYDVSISMARSYRMEQLRRVAEATPGVLAVEGWLQSGATRVRDDDSKSNFFRLQAVPPATSLIDPQMERGAWLDTAVSNGIVVNSDLLDDEPDLRVGGPITLEINGRELDGTVAGIIRTDSGGPLAYMSYDDYAYFTRTPGQATQVQVSGAAHDAAAQDELRQALFQAYEDAGFEVSGTRTAQQINAQNELMFTIIVAFLILMALLLAAVGGLGLTTTMSINILERIREIGVLRAVGASNFSVGQIVLAEGLVIGALSWLFGAALSVPISAFLSDQVGLALLNVPLTYQYSLGAAVLWFFALMAIAVAASLGPARDAVRLTIREVLAYE
jgi:putative ABC transport system permease protein